MRRAEARLEEECSLMATPSKRDSVNAQSSFNFRSVDSQTISFRLSCPLKHTSLDIREDGK